MKMPMIMTPGPTYVHEDVRRVLSMEMTNPDLDPGFFEFYRETCTIIQQLLKTKNEVLILCGEGILGLEAACASLIEPGDRVLCIDNGIYGNGFGDFAKMYGAEVVYFKSDYRKAVDINALRNFLKENKNFKIATVVHCETPSGITNPVNLICPLLKEYNILTVVDSVSGIGGEPLETDEWKIDIIIGGSQKCLSAPPGLTFLGISKDAWNKILNRKVSIAGFYLNLAIWFDWYKKKWFPYTQPINEIYALRKAVERVLEDAEGVIERHRVIGSAVRESLALSGLELYPVLGFSNTVTTVNIPDGITFNELFNEMYNSHGIMIAGAFDFLRDKVFRIGHMGENCREEKVYITLKTLNNVFKSHGIRLKKDIHKVFSEIVK